MLSFAPLTGTFDITATDLTYGPADAYGVRRGSTAVTVTNLTGGVIDYPLVTFPASSGAADHTLWTGCPVVIRRPDKTVCVAEPLAAGEQRAIAFPFVTEWPEMLFDATVRVDAGADRRPGAARPGRPQGRAARPGPLRSATPFTTA